MDRNRSVSRLAWGLALSCAALALGAASAMAAEWWDEAGLAVKLSAPGSSQLVAEHYPADNVRLDLIVELSRPGTLLDTVGINGAATGDWQISVGDDLLPRLYVYAPQHGSAVATGNGWHVFTAVTPLKPGERHWLTLVVKDGDMGLVVNGRIEVQQALPVKLSGRPVYAGDFPGDDAWGEQYAIHPAAGANLHVVYFGPFHPDIGVEVLGESVVQRGGSEGGSSGGRDGGLRLPLGKLTRWS